MTHQQKLHSASSPFTIHILMFSRRQPCSRTTLNRAIELGYQSFNSASACTSRNYQKSCGKAKIGASYRNIVPLRQRLQVGSQARQHPGALRHVGPVLPEVERHAVQDQQLDLRGRQGGICRLPRLRA